MYKLEREADTKKAGIVKLKTVSGSNYYLNLNLDYLRLSIHSLALINA